MAEITLKNVKSVKMKLCQTCGKKTPHGFIVRTRLATVLQCIMCQVIKTHRVDKN